MLIGNGMLIHKLPMTFLGRHWVAFVNDTALPGSTFPSGLGATAAIPDGYYAPQAFMMPRTAGSLSGRFTILGVGGVVASGESAMDALATLSGSGGVSSAMGGLIVNLLASISGSGGISSADIQAFLNLAATIGGDGGITGSTLVGLGALDALLSGSGDAEATATATGELEATLRGYGDLTPEGIRDAVWKALAADFTAAGTMGAKLNAASSAGDPWATSLPGSYPAGSAGAIMGVFLADVWRRLGLDASNPQETTTAAGVTTITDGTLTLTVTEHPDGSVTVQRS